MEKIQQNKENFWGMFDDFSGFHLEKHSDISPKNGD
jgi:hypothetical protein